MSAGHWVMDWARALEFGLCGIARAEPSPHAQHVRRWIARGMHGQMGYLEEHLDVRLDPGRLVEGAKSVIVVADRYASEDRAEPAAGEARVAAHGRVARYAWGDDYHKVIKKRLHRLCDALAERFSGDVFRAAVDTAPVMERDLAVAAGLGWVGKHTLLIHPRHGSWFLLGVVVTTLDLPDSKELDHAGGTSSGGGHCGTCTRCIDACPTDAIAAEGYTLDATRCISYLTLEHRSAIDPALHEGMGDWLAGCDICQEVCPHNRERDAFGRTGLSEYGQLPIHPAYAPRNTSLDLLAVLGWSSGDRQAAFRGSALKRMKLEMVKRNAVIAAGNALRRRWDDALYARLTALANDTNEHALVRQTAQDVLDALADAGLARATSP